MHVSWLSTVSFSLFISTDNFVNCPILYLQMFCLSFLCLCFSIFHISVDFRVPLADALGQIRIILNRFWCHFWINFPALSAARAELLQRLRKKLLKKFAENLQRTIKKVTKNAKNLQRISNKLMQRTFPQAKSQAAYSILRRDFC